MQRFEFTDRTVKVIKATHRKENHGKGKKGKANKVQAVTLRLRVDGPAYEVLPLVDPTLHPALYWTPPHVAAQQAAPGMEQPAVHLRTAAIEMPLDVKREFAGGYGISIVHGVDDDLELYDCKIDKIRVEAKDGGQCGLEWNVSSSKEITKELLGALCVLEGVEVKAHQAGPAVDGAPRTEATGAEIDGSVGHPGADSAQGSLIDQGALTPESALAGSGDPEDDDTDPDSEGGHTDADAGAAEQAEIEAGMRESLAAAGVKPKGARRGRRETAVAPE